MATGREIMRLVAMRTGVEYDRVEKLAHGLIKAGAWDGEEQAVVYLLLAVLAGAETNSAASIAKHYYDLQLVGSDKNNGTPLRAGEMIDKMLNSFLTQARTPFSAYAYKSRIEVYTGTPAIRVHTSCLDKPLDLTYLEHDAEDWHQTTVRRSTILPGKVLFDIAADVLMTQQQQTLNAPFRFADNGSQHV